MSTARTERRTSPDRRFGLKAAALVGSVAAAGWLTAFVVVPVIDGRDSGLSALAAICRAIGIGPSAPAAFGPAAHPASEVAWNASTLAALARGDIAKGAAIAQEICQSCHDVNGLVTKPGIPSMTGQSARAIYKQLADFQSGARYSETMSPIAIDLKPAQLADVAAFYASLPRRNSDIHDRAEAGPEIETLVLRGDAGRALPPCAACHAAHSGGPLEAPLLVGQFPDYTASQLTAYRQGERRNDLYGRMRAIAAKLTPKEIAALAAYYNARP